MRLRWKIIIGLVVFALAAWIYYSSRTSSGILDGDENSSSTESMIETEDSLKEDSLQEALDAIEILEELEGRN